MTQIYDVIVIGCGISGFAALIELVKHNYKVLGLEASSRIGGRILTIPFGENVVDLGAQWCHAEKNNAIYSLIKELNVVTPNKHKEHIFLKSSGEKMLFDDVKQYLTLFSSIKVSAKNHTIEKTESLYHYLKNEYNKKITENGFNLEIAHEIFNYCIQSVQAKISSNELLDRSLQGLNESRDSDVVNWLNWKDKGYETIFDIIMNKYPDPTKTIPVDVLFNKDVINIKWNNSLAEHDNSESFVQIKCRDNSLYTAKHVISTISLGVLKERYEYLFTPAIPDDKILSIRSMAMVTMNKIYMKFSEKWWPQPMMRFSIIWKKEDKAEFTDEDDWLMGIYEVTTVDNQPNLLCIWIIGTWAENMELCSSEEVKNTLNRFINHFFSPQYKTQNVLEILRSTWYTNDLTRGAFCYRSVETECVNKGISVLVEPLINNKGLPIVCFAGEATSQYHYSTAHGALESGIREAKRLMSILKK